MQYLVGLTSRDGCEVEGETAPSRALLRQGALQEHVANDLVETEEVPKASLDDGPEALAIRIQVTLGLRNVNLLEGSLSAHVVPTDRDYDYPVQISSHPEEREDLHEAPQPLTVRLPRQHQKLQARNDEE